MISHDEDANYRWGFRRLRSWPARWLSANDIADLAAADAAVAGDAPAPVSETASMPPPAAPKAEQDIDKRNDGIARCSSRCGRMRAQGCVEYT
jgi:hypothetical protein